ncbi:MAG: MgtC/SapB family protein [Clostridia bacterium]|nr:MgtC/SapB family protein [Clostridia bacterium]
MPEFLENFYQTVIVDSYIIRMIVASICGGLIGLERSRRQKDAGIRTHMIVALGAAMIIIVSKYGFFDILQYEGLRADASRIASNVVTGVGFLGAGVIFVKDISIKGLTTAAGIWTTAGVGLAIGAGMYPLGIAASVMMVVSQLILHRFFSRLENTANEFVVIVTDTKDSVKSLKRKLEEKNIHIEKCNITRNQDATLRLDITVKKSRMISMDEIMLLIEQDDSIISVDI